MSVTRIVDFINTFLAQCCMSVGKSGHERVNKCHGKEHFFLNGMIPITRDKYRTHAHQNTALYTIKINAIPLSIFMGAQLKHDNSATYDNSTNSQLGPDSPCMYM